jgi:hypothetical protein
MIGKNANTDIKKTRRIVLWQIFLLTKIFRNTQWGTLIHIDQVPKCEIFDRSDFNDFYTIKSLREGDCGVKI